MGLDNINGYYDTALKYGRLKERAYGKRRWIGIN